MTTHNFPLLTPSEHNTRIMSCDWSLPEQWQRDAQAAGETRRVIVEGDLWEAGSLARQAVRDASGNDIEISSPEICDGVRRVDVLSISNIRQRLFRLIDATPNLHWCLETAEPGKVLSGWDFEPAGLASPFPGAPGDIGKPLPCYRRKRRPNVSLYAIIQTQADADRLDNCPGAIVELASNVGVLCQPTEPIVLRFPFYDHIRVRGGDKAMHPDWVRSLRDRAQADGMAFCFEGWGDYAPDSCNDSRLLGCVVVCPDGEILEGKRMLDRPDIQDAEIMMYVGSARSGRMLDGVEHDEWPEVT